MFSWDPDNVEKIAPFTPSCHQSTWKIDDVDRITPFFPIRQCTWRVDDVDQIESFVPSVSPASQNLRTPSSCSSQYDSASSISPQPYVPSSGSMDTSATKIRNCDSAHNVSQDSQPISVDQDPETGLENPRGSAASESTSISPQQHVPSSGSMDTSATKIRNSDSAHNASTELGVQDSQPISVNEDLETGLENPRGSAASESTSISPVCGSDTSTEFVDPVNSCSHASRSTKSSPTSQHTDSDLDTSAEFVDPQCSSSPIFKSDTQSELNTSNEDTNPHCSSSQHYISVNNSQTFEGELLQDSSGSLYMSEDMPAESVLKDIATVVHTSVNNSNTSDCTPQGDVSGSSSNSLVLEPTHNDFDTCAEFVEQERSSRSCNSDDLSSPQCSSANPKHDCIGKEDNFDVVQFLQSLDLGSNQNGAECSISLDFCREYKDTIERILQDTTGGSDDNFSVAKLLGALDLGSNQNGAECSISLDFCREYKDTIQRILQDGSDDNFSVAKLLGALDFGSKNNDVANWRDVSDSLDYQDAVEQVLRDNTSPICTSDDDEDLAYGNTEGSLEMSTEFVIQDGLLHGESSNNYHTADSLDSSDNDDDYKPLPVHQGEMESYSTTADTYNPYPFSRTCFAASNSIGRGKDLSGKLELDLKDEFLRRRARMDGDFVPSMGRGAILETYYNRHRTDESLNKQLRTTLGVGYSNEVTEHFWRGEQEEIEPAERDPSPPVEVDDLTPAEEPVSLISPDIILVSPGNTIVPKKPAASPRKSAECPPVSSGNTSPKKSSTPFEKSGIKFVSPGNTIGPKKPAASPRKSAECPPVLSGNTSPKKSSTPFEKSGIKFVSPGNTIVPKKPAASPRKPVECPPVSSGNTSPRKSSTPFEKSGIKFVSPGNTIGPRVTSTQSWRDVESSASTVEIPSEQSSPKKKKKTTSIRKNRNALLNSLAIQKGLENHTTPGMPPGALNYVHLDTSENYKELKEFHYEKEDFPPLC